MKKLSKNARSPADLAPILYDWRGDLPDTEQDVLGGYWPPRDGDRLLQARDRWDRHRHARPCAASLLRRLGVSAWAGEAEDPVLQHARGPCRVLGGGRWPGVVV